MEITDKSMLIFGHGYVAKFLTSKLTELGFTVYSTSRDSASVTNQNQNLIIVDFEDKIVDKLLSSAPFVLITAPPNEIGSDPVLSRYQDHFIAHKHYQWIGYLSSTSVYGDHQGAWVDETSKCEAKHPKETTRLAAEQQWSDLYEKHDLPIHIFRLAGIYGPERNCMQRIRNGKDHTIVKTGQFFSRIHVFDICSALIASMNKPTIGEIYNLADDEPAALNEVDQYGAMLLGVAPLVEIPFEQAQLSDMAKSFFLANKKVSSKKISDSLSILWRYPNYRIGLSEGCLPYLIDA